MPTPFVEFQQEGYTISTDPSRLDIDTIHAYLANESYWASGIPLAIVKKSIKLLTGAAFAAEHHHRICRGNLFEQAIDPAHYRGLSDESARARCTVRAPVVPLLERL